MLIITVKYATRNTSRQNTTDSISRTCTKWSWHLLKQHLIPYHPKTPNNASSHCDSCDWTFYSKHTYRHQLEKLHQMNLPPLQKPIRDPNVLQDIASPDFYCKSCHVIYKNGRSYRLHLKRVHQMELSQHRKKTAMDPTITADGFDNPNQPRCTICNRKYSKQKCLSTSYENRSQRWKKHSWS